MAPKNDRNLLHGIYNPPDTVTQAPNTLPPAQIKINPNNWMARLDGNQDPNTVIGRLIKFFRTCPLAGALTLNPSRMYHEYLCEFWHSATFDSATQTINFSLKQGQRQCSISKDTIRAALNLNYFVENEAPVEIPQGTNLRQVLLEMGSADCTDKDGVLKTKGTMQLKNLSPSWRFFFIHIVECLGGGSGGLDQINQQQLEIAYCLWNGLRVDFAEILFRSILEKMKGKRKEFVPFIRFLSLCFKHILGDQYDDPTLDSSPPEYLKDLKSYVSSPTDVSIPALMLTSFKTDAAIPAESERSLGGLQKNEGPTRSSTGVLHVTRPRRHETQPHPKVHTSSQPTGSLQTGSPAPKAKNTRGKKPVMATGETTQAIPTEVSKQASVESQMGTLQAATSNILLGGSGEVLSGSAQPTLESVSAQAQDSHISDTTLARSGDATGLTHLVVEDPNSTADDIALDSSSVIEAVPVSVVPGNDVVMTEPQTGPLNQDISDAFLDPSLDADEDIVTIESSDSEATASDTEMDHGPTYTFVSSSRIMASRPQFSFATTTTTTTTSPDIIAPPIFPPNTQTPQTDTETPIPVNTTTTSPEITTTTTPQITSLFPSQQIEKLVPFPSVSRPESPPETLDNRMDTIKTEIQSLFQQVEDLKKSILEHTKALLELKKSHSGYYSTISADTGRFARNEDAVFKKLNELVECCNIQIMALEKAFDLTQSNLLSSVDNHMKEILGKTVQEIKSIESQLKEAIQRTGIDTEDLINQVVEKVSVKLEESLAKRDEELVKKVVSEITKVIPSVDLKPFQKEISTMKEDIQSLTTSFNDQATELAGLVGVIQNSDGYSQKDRDAVSGLTKLQKEFDVKMDAQMKELDNAKRHVRLLCTILRECQASQSWNSLSQLPFSKSDWEAVQQALDSSRGEELKTGPGQTSEEQPGDGLSIALAAFMKKVPGTDASEQVIEEFVDVGTGDATHEKPKETVVAQETEKAQPAGTDASLGKSKAGESMPEISKSHHDQLQEIAKRIQQRKTAAKDQQILYKGQMSSMGTLEHAEAGLLGIPVEKYKLVKDHPNIIKAIAILDEVELTRDYPDDEAMLDSKTTNVPVDQCKKTRQKGIEAETAKARQLVLDVLTPPKKQGPVPKTMTAKQRKEKKEADLRTWVDPSAVITKEQILEAAKKISKPFDRLDTAEDAREYFENMAHKRVHPGKIVEFQVTIKPGTQHFQISIVRENGPTTFTDNPDLFDYGFSEWTEMVRILEAKPSKNRFDKVWLSTLKKKLDSKDQVLQRLQSQGPSEQVQPLTRKRKATEEPSSA